MSFQPNRWQMNVCTISLNLMQLNPDEEASVLFVTPSWLGNNACDLMATNMNQILGWPSANVEVVDFSDVVSVSTTSIMSTDIAGIPPSAFTPLEYCLWWEHARRIGHSSQAG